MSPNNYPLGEFLRQEREKRGISIQQVASATRINIKLLQLLENDQYNELPAKPFIRGFVTSYTKYLGLDTQEILTQYHHFLEEHSHERPEKSGGFEGYAFERKDGDPSKKMLWTLMVSFIVLGGVTMVILKPKLKHHRSSHADKLQAAFASPTPSVSPSVTAHAEISPSPSPSAVVIVHTSPTPSPTVSSKASPSPKASSSPKPSPSATPKASPSPKPSASETPDPLNKGDGLKPEEVKQRVMFKALEDLWVRYKVDDKPMIKFVLRKGRLLTIKARETVRFQVSNPKAIQVKYQTSNYVSAEGHGLAISKSNGTVFVFPMTSAEGNSSVFESEKALPNDVPASPAITPEP